MVNSALGIIMNKIMVTGQQYCSMTKNRLLETNKPEPTQDYGVAGK